MTDYPSAISQDIGLTPSVITLKVKVKVKSLSHIRLFATPCNVAYQAPLSMGFSRPEYWSGLPFPSPGDLPNPGIEPGSPALQADTLPSEPPGKSVITLKLIFYIGYPKYVDDCGEYVRAVAKNGQTRWQVCIGVVFSWLLFSHEKGSKDHPSPCAAFWVTCQGLIKVTKSLCA